MISCWDWPWIIPEFVSFTFFLSCNKVFSSLPQVSTVKSFNFINFTVIYPHTLLNNFSLSRLSICLLVISFCAECNIFTFFILSIIIIVLLSLCARIFVSPKSFVNIKNFAGERIEEVFWHDWKNMKRNLMIYWEMEKVLMENFKIEGILF